MEVFLILPVVLVIGLFMLLIRSKGKRRGRRRGQTTCDEITFQKELYHETNVLHDQIEKYYELKDQLGTGATSVVLYAEHLETGVHYAAKVVNRHNMNKNDVKLVQNEIRIMKSLNHPNIVKFKEVFETKHSTCIILELASGGELLDRLSRMDDYNERIASRIMKQLLSALDYLHTTGIIHMDIKPRNILFHTKDDEPIIKLSDFGFSNEVANLEGVWDYIVGTPEFIAPEVITGGVEFGAPVDIWSSGIILYIMLMGSSPFIADDTDAIFALIKKGEYTICDSITEKARDLLAEMLQMNPFDRITASEALDHPWITEPETLPSTPLPFVTQRIRRFNARLKLRMGITAVIVTNRFLANLKKRRMVLRDLSARALIDGSKTNKRRTRTSSLEPRSPSQSQGLNQVQGQSGLGLYQSQSQGHSPSQVTKKRNKTLSHNPVKVVHED
eukprot:TRINITY_DN8085_c0_g1_i1.p1 TRINITY_DN8085_c0_g1~~TRINITY_DN8085_c0_g1_i1.p1  ORF type:complete len:445 (-),score=78.86 TRINITY_DN8085_c0_g1_i1:98-1432(-)